MGIFDGIFKRREENTPSNTIELSPPIVDDVLLRALLSGETITREKAMTIPAICGAVDLITSSIASMPVKLYKYRDGKVEEVEKDTRVKMLNGDTGDKLDGFQMKKAMVEDYLMGKGGYCYIRKYRNEVTGLFYVQEKDIQILQSSEPIFKSYQIYVNNKQYKDYDFIKLLRNTKDGASGTGLTVEIAKELETAYQTLLYQLGMVKSGGSKKGFIKSQRRLGADEISALKSAWNNLYSTNTENAVVLNNGLEFQEASSSSVEMQMNESKRTLTEEINGLFHISSDFDMTFKLAIYPIVKAFETALNRDLLLEKEKKNHFFEFDVKELIKANIKDRYEAYQMAKSIGFMTVNEIRRAENMNYIEGMDVINVGLGAVLYDINTHQYYTPNTDTLSTPSDDTMPVPEEEETTEEEITEEEVSLENRFNPNHNKDGRFGFGSGGAWAQSIKGQFDALPDNKKALRLAREEFLSKEDALKSWKDGTLNDKVDSYIRLLEENGDFSPNGRTRDNSVRIDEIVKENGGDYIQARKTLIKEDTGFTDEEVEKTYQELDTWFSNRWDKADTETLDKYVESSPVYDGIMHRGMHFETPEQMQEFAGSMNVGDRIYMGGKNSSWTSNEETARGYAHNNDDTYSSILFTCVKNKTSSPVDDLSVKQEQEVLASSKAQWTILRTESATMPSGQKKMRVYVMEVDTDGES